MELCEVVRLNINDCRQARRSIIKGIWELVFFSSGPLRYLLLRLIEVLDASFDWFNQVGLVKDLVTIKYNKVQSSLRVLLRGIPVSSRGKAVLR